MQKTQSKPDELDADFDDLDLNVNVPEEIYREDDEIEFAGSPEPVDEDELLNTENPDKMKAPAYSAKKVTIITAIIFAVLLIIGIIVFFVMSGTNGSQKITASLAYMEGDVFSLTSDGKWIAAKTGLKLEQGSAIRVGGSGRAVINLTDDSAIRLNSGSTATLTTLDNNHVVVTNSLGEVYARVAKSNRVFDVVVDGVTYRAQGTAFKTIFFQDTATDAEDISSTTSVKGDTILNGVEVYEGKVQIIGSNSANISLISQGEKYFMVNSDEMDQARKIITVTAEDIQKDEFLMWNKDLDSKISAFKDQLGILSNNNAPALKINSPMDEELTNSEKIIISGTCDKNAKLTVNGELVKNNNGTFSYDLTLLIGINKIKVIAEDAQGNMAVKNITVTYEVLTTTTPSPTVSPTITPSFTPTTAPTTATPTATPTTAPTTVAPTTPVVSPT